MLDRDGSQLLIIGPAMSRFSDTWNADQPVLAVPVPGNHTAADNTVQLRWNDLPGTSAQLITPHETSSVRLPAQLFTRMKPAAALAQLSRTHWHGLDAAPLFLLGRSGSTFTAHTSVRLGEIDGLFVRVPAFAPSSDAQNVTALLDTLLAALKADKEFFNNHQCCYRKFWPSDELEHKLTLDGPIDLHAVTVGLRNLVGTPHLPGTIWDYRDDYQIWDFDNHLYEITGPPHEAGYISFIPDSSGTVIVKRKWFTTNTVRRRESRWRGVRISANADSFDSYARSNVHGDVRFRGVFRRTRLDSTCEFTRTGNVYGFMIDWCRPVGRPSAPHLYQIEVEYLHSRTRDDRAQHAIGRELAAVAEATRAYLDRMGIAHRPGDSKLTYLRSLVSTEHS